MASKFIDLAGLAKFKEKQDAADAAKFVAQVPGKGLSTNDLTDELKEKIERAGVSDFSGAYADLTGKPSIEGHELAGGANTAASLGLAAAAHKHETADIAGLDSALAGKAAAVHTHAQADVTGLEAALAGKQAKGDYATNSALSAAKSELQGKIDTALSSVYEPKGSTAFASLPTPSAGTVGDVYNVTDAFTTTDAFVEGAGKSYPAGSNVVAVNASGAYKWDVLAGMVDLTPYLKKADISAVSTAEIEGLF